MRAFGVAVGVLAILATAGLMLVANFGGGSPGIEAPVTTAPAGTAADNGPIHLVEIASRPNYRIVRFDPTTGAIDPVFALPESGVVNSVALSPDGRRLVLAYTEDFTTPGNGVYELSADGGEPRLLWPEATGTTYADLVFDPNGSTVWATEESSGGQSVVSIDLGSNANGSNATGSNAIGPNALGTVIDGAVYPAHGGAWLAYLRLQPDGSRRSIEVLDLAAGTTRSYAVLDGRYDLDHLLADPERNRLVFAALVPEGEGRVTIGEPAGAHGSHDGPSQWLTLDLDTAQVSLLAEHEPRTVRDAVMRDDGIVLFTTLEGLVAHGATQQLLLDSRILTQLSG